MTLEGTDRGTLSIALSQAYSGTKRQLNPYLLLKVVDHNYVLSLYENFSRDYEKTAFNVNFPTNPQVKYPDCIKIAPIGRRDTSNFGIDIFKSQDLYTAKIDTIAKNSSSNPDDDYINCSNGYLTVSPVYMGTQRDKVFEKLKKVKF